MSEDTPRISGAELLYVLLGIVGLVASWAQVSGYLDHGLLAGNVLFWKDAVANPAGTFLTVDVLVLAAALTAWMFGEGRRLGIRPGWLWGYFLGSLLIGISCALPLFLAHRQRRIRRDRPGETSFPAGADWAAVSIALSIALVAVAYSLRHHAVG
jgi:hypothetical protein